MIGGVCEGKLEAIGLGQQQADVLVIPAGSRQILEEEQQLLGEGERQTVIESSGYRPGPKRIYLGDLCQQQGDSLGQCPQPLCPLLLTWPSTPPSQTLAFTDLICYPAQHLRSHTVGLLHTSVGTPLSLTFQGDSISHPHGQEAGEF